ERAELVGEPALVLCAADVALDARDRLHRQNPAGAEIETVAQRAEPAHRGAAAVDARRATPQAAAQVAQACNRLLVAGAETLDAAQEAGPLHVAQIEHVVTERH